MGRQSIAARQLRGKGSYQLERHNRDKAARLAKAQGLSLPRWVEMLIKREIDNKSGATQ